MPVHSATDERLSNPIMSIFFLPLLLDDLKGVMRVISPPVGEVYPAFINTLYQSLAQIKALMRLASFSPARSRMSPQGYKPLKSTKGSLLPRQRKYKRSTLGRRLQRRMQILRLAGGGNEYVTKGGSFNSFTEIIRTRRRGSGPPVRPE